MASVLKLRFMARRKDRAVSIKSAFELDQNPELFNLIQINFLQNLFQRLYPIRMRRDDTAAMGASVNANTNKAPRKYSSAAMESPCTA